jgi:hypothetical protein
VEVVEFGRLSGDQRAELEGDELDPFDAHRIDPKLQWRATARRAARL